jgi:hypothetical protein
MKRLHRAQHGLDTDVLFNKNDEGVEVGWDRGSM